jgi:hypothetical protein
LRWWIPPGICVLFACGHDTSAPLGTPPDVRGSFVGTWDLGNSRASYSCPGIINIVTQTGTTTGRDSVTGGFAVQIQPAGVCQSEMTGTVAGSVRGDSTVALAPQVPGGDPVGMGDLTGCQFMRGDQSLDGKVVGRVLIISASAHFTCANWFGSGEMDVTVDFGGTRP